MVARFTSLQDYVAAAPEDVRPLLEEIRRRIHAAVPGADEAIAYQMPTMKLAGKSFIHFAAWKHHISVYPIPAVTGDLAKQVAAYRATEGTLKLPLTDPIPFALIAELAVLLAEERFAQEQPRTER